MILSTSSTFLNEAKATNQELFYDNGSSDYGLIASAGEVAAVKFSSGSGLGVIQVLKLRFYCWGNISNVKVHVLDKNFNSIYSRLVLANRIILNGDWFDVDISANNIILNGDFYVAWEWPSGGRPWLGVDNTPPHNMHSYLGTLGSSGIPNEKENYMIRVEVLKPRFSNVIDPTGDLSYSNGSIAPIWSVIDIVYADVSQVDSANLRLLMRANATIPLKNQGQGYYWILDTGIPTSDVTLPHELGTVDTNGINVDYIVGVSWVETGELHVSVLKYDGTYYLNIDARPHPENYFNGDNCSITIPFSWIGNPNSLIRWVAISTDGVGGSSRRYDKAPNTGYATLLVTPSGYQVTTVNYSWLDAVTGGTVVADGADIYTQVTLPFSFKFYGNSYSSLYICSNGILTFGSGTTTASNVAIPNAAAPNNFIAPFWDDFNPTASGSGKIYYKSFSKYVVISWENVLVSVPDIPNYQPQKFQVILYETGEIRFQYSTLNRGYTCTVGVENSSGTAGTIYTSFLTNGLALKFSLVYGTD